MIAWASLCFQCIDFLQQDEQIDDHTRTDHAQCVVIENARGQQVKNGFFAIDDNGVSGIVSALETDDHIYMSSKQVNDFSFAFISPLGTDYYISSHNNLLFYLQYHSINIGVSCMKLV